MTAIVASRPYSSYLSALVPTQSGVSEAALRISEILTRTAVELVRSATGQARIADPLSSLDRLFEECSTENWDGEGAAAISYNAFEEAERLLYALPSFIPPPDVLPEPIGAIAFEWYRNPSYIYVLSVKGIHSVEFAGIFGPGDEVHGKANFDGCLPAMVAEHLRTFFHQQSAVAFDRPPGERLSRYIVERNHIRSSNQTVKHNAFMPPLSGRLSVYRTTDLVENEVWQLGHEYVAPVRQKAILARGDMNSVVAYAEGLVVETAPNPHPRHANITGWDMNSTRVRLQALNLAAAAKLVMLPSASDGPSRGS